MFKPANGARLDQVPGVLDVQRDNCQWAVTVEGIDEARSSLAALGKGSETIVDLNLDEIFEAYVIGRREVSDG